MPAGTAENKIKDPFRAATQIALFRNPVLLVLGVRARVMQGVDGIRSRSSDPCMRLLRLLLRLRLLLLLLRLRLLFLLLRLRLLLARTTATAVRDRGGFGAERRDEALSVLSAER